MPGVDCKNSFDSRLCLVPRFLLLLFVTLVGSGSTRGWAQTKEPWDGLNSLYAERARPWWLQAMGYSEGLRVLAEREFTMGASGFEAADTPVIAVFDSGVDYTHPGIAQRVWQHQYVGLAGCEADFAGCDLTRPVPGLLGSGPAAPLLQQDLGLLCRSASVAPENSDRLNACQHGTHVAGLIAGDWTQGFFGSCPLCQILPLKVVEVRAGKVKIADQAILRGLHYIANLNRLSHGRIKIVNFSFGKFEQTVEITEAIGALQKTGVLFVAAAGNEASRSPVYPAALPGVIGVTALARSGRKADYANYGAWLDIAAPGGGQGPFAAEGIYSVVPGGGGAYAHGTSVAAPLVAGLAGLLLCAEPGLSSDDLRRRILGSVQINIYDPSYANGYNAPFAPRKLTGPFSLIAPGLLGRGLISLPGALSEAVDSGRDFGRHSLRSCGVVNGLGKKRVQPDIFAGIAAPNSA